VPLGRPQFTVTGLMIAVAVFAVMTAALFHLYPEAVWVGRTSIPLEFVILDAPTGQPLQGASIRLTENTPEYRATTAADGRAKIVIDATIGGRSSLVRNTRLVNYAWALLISCEGHRTVNQDLRDVTRGPSFQSDLAPPTIVVRLAPCR
jgi:hypothetical protein